MYSLRKRASSQTKAIMTVALVGVFSLLVFLFFKEESESSRGLQTDSTKSQKPKVPAKIELANEPVKLTPVRKDPKKVGPEIAPKILPKKLPDIRKKPVSFKEFLAEAKELLKQPSANLTDHLLAFEKQASQGPEELRQVLQAQKNSPDSAISQLLAQAIARHAKAIERQEFVAQLQPQVDKTTRLATLHGLTVHPQDQDIVVLRELAENHTIDLDYRVQVVRALGQIVRNHTTRATSLSEVALASIKGTIEGLATKDPFSKIRETAKQTGRPEVNRRRPRH